MPRKNEKVTHVRISKEDLSILESLKGVKETNRNVLSRVIKDYDNDGVKRELVKHISELQLFVNNFIHPDLHDCLEVLKAIFVNIESSTNQIESSLICNLLKENLVNTRKELKENIILKDKPDKK